jgi:hypothetical protein
VATRKSTIGALRPSGNHAKVYSGSSVVLPSLDIEGGSPAIWLEIDGSVRKRVLETHGPKTSHPQVSQNSRTRQKTGVERCRQKVEKAVGARGSTHGNIDSLVNKHLASFRNAEKTFAGAKALVQTYREKYPQLADYIPEGAVEQGIHIRENATDESEGLHKFHIRIRWREPWYEVAGADQHDYQQVNAATWTQRFKEQLAISIAKIVFAREAA